MKNKALFNARLWKEELKSLSLGHPSPTDYFKGIAPEAPRCPTNVILFIRQDRTELQLVAPRHQHHRNVLVINLETAGVVGVGEQLINLHPGQAVLIRPHQAHYFPHINADHLHWLFITFEGWADGQQQTSLEQTRSIRSDAASYLHLLVTELVSRRSSIGKQAPLIPYLLGAFLTVLEESGSKESDAAGFDHAELFSRINQYIHRHLSEPIAIKQIAVELGVSESHLRALFRQQAGLSLGRYITQARINRATRLLRESRLSVGEVATACGCDSIHSFSRSFHKAVGMPPRAYRAAYAGR